MERTASCTKLAGPPLALMTRMPSTDMPSVCPFLRNGMYAQ